jgi:hypothetical protein
MVEQMRVVNVTSMTSGCGQGGMYCPKNELLLVACPLALQMEHWPKGDEFEAQLDPSSDDSIQNLMGSSFCNGFSNEGNWANLFVPKRDVLS